MNSSQISLGLLLTTLVVLILLSAFFSSSETSMMALNRYRLRHKARTGHKGAQRVVRLLKRTDRLLSAILIGNNFINILASSLATMVALRLFGDAGVVIATLVLTFALLIFGEVTPKMLAAMYPERVALMASVVLGVLMKLFYPLTVAINGVSVGLLRLFGVKTALAPQDNLSQEELRTLVHEAGGLLPQQRQGMLLGVLDLDMVDVDHIMIPRNEIVGIDLDDDIETILLRLQNVQHTRLPVYRGDINNMVGLLHIRSVARMISQNAVTKEKIQEEMASPYYVPEGTPLHTQLYNFQKEKRRLAIVVDEYGDIQGLVALEDILEEIVGKFTTDVDDNSDEIILRKDGSFTIKGTANVWEINKTLGWTLPIDGPKTFNGLITEVLEVIPDGRSCIVIGPYCIEILTLSGNKVETARVVVRK